LRLIEHEDRTASVLRHATGRLTARDAHRRELEPVEGSAGFERQQRYLEAVDLSRRGSVTHSMYLAEAGV
jgi:hypothetical protein